MLQIEQTATEAAVLAFTPVNIRQKAERLVELLANIEGASGSDNYDLSLAEELSQEIAEAAATLD